MNAYEVPDRPLPLCYGPKRPNLHFRLDHINLPKHFQPTPMDRRNKNPTKHLSNPIPNHF